MRRHCRGEVTRVLQSIRVKKTEIEVRFCRFRPNKGTNVTVDSSVADTGDKILFEFRLHSYLRKCALCFHYAAVTKLLVREGIVAVLSEFPCTLKNWFLFNHTTLPPPNVLKILSVYDWTGSISPGCTALGARRDADPSTHSPHGAPIPPRDEPELSTVLTGSINGPYYNKGEMRQLCGRGPQVVMKLRLRGSCPLGIEVLDS